MASNVMVLLRGVVCGVGENGESCIIHTEHHNLFFSATVMISSRRKQSGHVVGTKDMRKAYKYYVGKFEAKIILSEFHYFPF
jgi:hypothetical protein